MFFIVIMAFALVLSEGLPPSQCNLFAGSPYTAGSPLIGTLTIVVAQLLLVAAAAFVSSRLTIGRLDYAAEGHDRAINTFSRCHRVLLGIVAFALVATMIFTPWAPLVREGWHLGRIPLLGDLVILAPFFISLAIIWTIFYPADLRIREAAVALSSHSASPETVQQSNDGGDLYVDGHSSLGTYLLDKFRHQVLIIAVPMSMIVFAKYFTDLARTEAEWPLFTRVPWAADSLLGLVSMCILTCAPLMLRYIWVTEPLPAGPLRDRFVKTCRRIGLRYREILLWHTHGTAINAAVMGFVAPLRYILVSDALLETMDEEEIEAVFGHEAGHVRHWHLQFFILFALVSMYVSGGVFLLLVYSGVVTDESLLQLASLAVLMAAWLFGFGWLSRRFERQADLYGVRCVTPDIKSCTDGCPVHGTGKKPSTTSDQPAALSNRQSPKVDRQSAIPPSPGLCTGAASLFGRTLLRIAQLNGIPKDALSWRHGSIEDRCRLIERFTSDATAVRRFDRTILLIKIGLVVASVVGTALAAWIYGGVILEILSS